MINKQLLKNQLKISSIASIFIYLCISFTKWNILWMSNINTWSNDDRSWTLFCFFVIHVASFCISIVLTDPD